METILVPGPPKEAFNKHRRMSDLIKKQVEHFKHLEHKLLPEQRAAVPQHAIRTEDEAARYITAMTRLLLGQSKTVKKKPMQMGKAAVADGGLALAAGGDGEANSEKISRKALKARGDDSEANSEKISRKALKARGDDSEANSEKVKRAAKPPQKTRKRKS